MSLSLFSYLFYFLIPWSLPSLLFYVTLTAILFWRRLIILPVVLGGMAIIIFTNFVMTISAPILKNTFPILINGSLLAVFGEYVARRHNILQWQSELMIGGITLAFVFVLAILGVTFILPIDFLLGFPNR